MPYAKHGAVPVNLPKAAPATVLGVKISEAMFANRENPDFLTFTKPELAAFIAACFKVSRKRRLTYLEHQLQGCALAARSYKEGVKHGEPFGAAFKAVLSLRQNADAAFNNAISTPHKQALKGE